TGLEIQGDAVDAVPQSRGRRAVVEYVTKMATAAAAVHFRARHAVAAIRGRADGAIERREEARPAGAAFELAIGDKARLTAARARERPRTTLVKQRARARPFGRVSTQDCILPGRQELTPFCVCLLDGIFGH